MGLVGIAHLLGPNSAAGAILTYIAPAITIPLGTCLQYLENQADRMVAKRRFEAACESLRLAINDPQFSDEQRAHWKRQLEEVVARDISSKISLIEQPAIPRLSGNPVSFAKEIAEALEGDT